MNTIFEEDLTIESQRSRKRESMRKNSKLVLTVFQDEYQDGDKYSKSLLTLQKKLEPWFSKIAKHALFRNIHSVRELKIFSESHVYAVWDFMCLLKSLQRKLTTVTIPWFPPLDALGGHLINEILVEEEGDVTGDGRYLSHFEMYLEAMEQLKANTNGIRQFLQSLKQGQSVNQAIHMDCVPEPARHFVQATFTILEQQLHQTTAAFVFGRENITYKMFQPIIDNLDEQELSKAQKFRYYLERHITLDQSSHAHKGFQLLENLCGDDKIKWQEAEQTAIDALQARLALLDGIDQAILAR